MIRHLKILLLVMAVIGLMAGSAFAGTTRVNHGATNTAYTAALEAMGAARNANISGLAITQATINSAAAISFQLGQALTSGNLLELSFTGAAFNGAQINVCAANGAADNNSIALATPAANATAFNFQTNFVASQNVAADNAIWFTSSVGVGACNTAVATNLMPIQISLTSSATTGTARVRSLVASVEVDTSTAVNLVRVISEFVPTLTVADTITIDYLGAPGTGVQFIAAGTGTNVIAGGAVDKVGIARNALLNLAATNTGAAPGAANIGLTTRAIVNLSDSQSWQGVSRVYLMATRGGASPACAIATNVASNTSPSGTISLTATAAGFNGDQSTNIGVCIEATGANALNPRTITGNQDISVTGTGANDPAASGNVAFQNWVLNAYQGFVGWLVNSATLPTYCLINNNDTIKTATVLMDVVSSEGAVVLSGTLGTIAPKTSNLATFTADSALLTGGTALSLSTLGADKRYGAKLTATANPSNVTISCIQTDPATGVKRSVPVFTNSLNQQ